MMFDCLRFILHFNELKSSAFLQNSLQNAMRLVPRVCTHSPAWFVMRMSFWLRFKLHLHNSILRRSHRALSQIPRRCTQCIWSGVFCAASQIKRRLINNCSAHYLWEKCQSHEIAQLLALKLARSIHHQLLAKWTASDAERRIAAAEQAETRRSIK